jgi:hypothetical protein
MKTKSEELFESFLCAQQCTLPENRRGLRERIPQTRLLGEGWQLRIDLRGEEPQLERRASGTLLSDRIRNMSDNVVT